MDKITVIDLIISRLNASLEVSNMKDTYLTQCNNIKEFRIIISHDCHAYNFEDVFFHLITAHQMKCYYPVMLSPHSAYISLKREYISSSTYSLWSYVKICYVFFHLLIQNKKRKTLKTMNL